MNNFPCSRCGACCRFAGQAPNHRRVGVEVGPDGACVHLLPDNTCAVYRDRPLACRIDETKPNWAPIDLWYQINLDACDRLHREVYGTPRIPMVAVLPEGAQPCYNGACTRPAPEATDD